jgi:chromatin segregation and condensation protein Rec8/ScpA/Scc1 (kleisin family)
MHAFLGQAFAQSRGKPVSFNSLLASTGARSAALAGGIFYQLLVLAARGVVRVQQRDQYGDMLVTKTDVFERTRASNGGSSGSSVAAAAAAGSQRASARSSRQ